MGAGQSRGKRNLNAKNTHAVQRNKSFRRNKSIRADAGYFLVKFKKRQVKIVNSESVEFRTIGAIVRSRVSVIREEWDRKLSFSMTVTEHSLETRAEMVAEVLTALHQLGEIKKPDHNCDESVVLTPACCMLRLGPDGAPGLLR